MVDITILIPTFLSVLTFLAVSAIHSGISRDMAFYLIAISNGASIIGRIAAGILGDRYGPLNMIIPFTLVVAVVTYGAVFFYHHLLLSLILFSAWPYAHNLVGYIFITIFYGYVEVVLSRTFKLNHSYSITFGAYVGLLPSPAASLGPLHSVGVRIGFQLTFMSFAILIGPPIAGAIRSTSSTGGFEQAGAYAGELFQGYEQIDLIVVFRIRHCGWGYIHGVDKEICNREVAGGKDIRNRELPAWFLNYMYICPKQYITAWRIQFN